MTTRTLIQRNTAEWMAMWADLTEYEAHRGCSPLDKDWEYIGTEEGDAGWRHLFRHVNHPQTRCTMVVRLYPSRKWMEGQKEQTP